MFPANNQAPPANAPYDAAFFAGIGSYAAEAAAAIVPLIVDLIHPKSVIDVGCGTGEWLARFKQNGVSRVCGIDGDYVDRTKLSISPDEFCAHDLINPIGITGRFDLAISLEVGEHLPGTIADQFIETLCRFAPVVAFSAAVPGQGGVQHLNEQWPDYWAKRFERNNYLAVDAVRYRLWNDDRIAWYYRQNLLIYVETSALARYPALLKDRESTHDELLAILHPGMYRGLLDTTSPEKQSLQTATIHFFRAVRASVKRRLGGKKP